MTLTNGRTSTYKLDRVKRIWYLSPMRAAKVQASLRIRSVSPEPSLLAHISSESRGTFRQKARFLAPLNGWACAVKICHDGMLEDTKSLDGAQFILNIHFKLSYAASRILTLRFLVWFCILWVLAIPKHKRIQSVLDCCLEVLLQILIQNYCADSSKPSES